MRRLVWGLIGAVVAVAAVLGAVTFWGTAEVDRDVPAAGAWKVLPDAGIAARSEPAVVWTRKAMIVWGGAGDAGVLGDGASYDLATDRWTPLPPAPITPRRGHTAVWTGNKMLIFGGQGPRDGCPGPCPLGDGAAYDPDTNTWTPLAAPPIGPRHSHTAVFLQARMVVWGGAGEGGTALGDGASYDPVTNTWAALPVPPLAPRLGHRTVATTDRMLVWGGSSEASEGGRYFADGAAYDPASDAWVPVAPAPLSGRGTSRAVWTSREMLVWGGFDSSVQADGALYNPVDGTWARMSPGPLAGRQHHAMVWTGRQVLVWGGEGAGGKLADGAALTLS